jgi:hypothetical protein
MSVPAHLVTASGVPITTASGLDILVGGVVLTQAPIRIIYPRGMTAKSWCNQMTLALVNATGVLPVVRTDSEWTGWARSASRQISLSNYNAPPPDRYKEWLPWANDFIRSLSTVGV